MSLVTKLRVRDKSLPVEYQDAQCIKFIRFQDCPSGTVYNYANPVTKIPVKVFQKKITDEIVTLPSDYTMRVNFLKSQEYKDWKLSFKPVSNILYSKLVIPPPPISYHNWYVYNASCTRHAYFSGVPYPNQWAIDNSGAGPLSGTDVIKATASYKAAVLMDANRINNMIRNLTSDARLLGLKTFSLANFIIEFRQSLNLVNIVKTKLTSLRDVNNSILSYNFGIKPLVSDIQAIIDILQHLHSRVDNWNDGVRKGKKFNTHITVFKGSFPLKNYTANDRYSYTTNTINGELSVLIKGHAYFYPQLIPDFMVDDLIRSLTGLDKPIGVAWEAIPYSFLVDWVFHVGDAIAAYEGSIPKVQISGQRFGYSIKQEAKFVSTFGLHLSKFPQDYKKGTDFVDPGQTGITSESYTEYTRVPITTFPVAPDFPVLEFTGSQSATHVGLAASLIGQRYLR